MLTANIIIAASGPGQSTVHQTRFGEIRSRSGANLQYACNDTAALGKSWKKLSPGLPDELHVVLTNPSLRDVEEAVVRMSVQLDSYPEVFGLNLFFAGHGEEGTGNLVLSGGSLSPTRFLELQAEDVGLNNQRKIGVFLDSCYSGAFLVRLAIEAYESFEGFSCRDGLASCLPDEESYEKCYLEHGVFTYTHLNKGNSYVDLPQFRKAILENDPIGLQKGLQGLVGTMSSATAFLTEGKQFSMSLFGSALIVDGGFAEVVLDKQRDYESVVADLTRFKHSI